MVKAVRGYGGVVFSDVIHAYRNHRRRRGRIVCVAGGAGGHAGTQSPSLVREIREFWDGPLVLGGAISTGIGARPR